MMNAGNPELAFEFSQLPNAGVGLARVEFIINNVIGIHPKVRMKKAGKRLPAFFSFSKELCSPLSFVFLSAAPDVSESENSRLFTVMPFS